MHEHKGFSQFNWPTVHSTSSIMFAKGHDINHYGQHLIFVHISNTFIPFRPFFYFHQLCIKSQHARIQSLDSWNKQQYIPYIRYMYDSLLKKNKILSSCWFLGQNQQNFRRAKICFSTVAVTNFVWHLRNEAQRIRRFTDCPEAI